MVKSLKLTVLVDDSANPLKPILTAKHGLSIAVEVKNDGEWFSFLIDAGPSSEVVLCNAEILNVDLSKINMIFLSHGHYDHTGGLIGVLRHINRKLPVIAHPRVFDPKMKVEPVLKYIGSPFSRSEVEEGGGLVLLSRNPLPVMKGVLTTGEIERVTPYERVSGFWTISRERFMDDALIDDQALIFKIEGKGLVIVSGCAHSGIMNTIRHSKKVMDVEKVYAVIGGFHLEDADEERIRLTVENLAKIDPEIIYPCHCTGQKAVDMLKKNFGDRCKPLKTGDVIDL